jgi:putative spermidine/putrescine transport system permease protein
MTLLETSAPASTEPAPRAVATPRRRPRRRAETAKTIGRGIFFATVIGFAVLPTVIAAASSLNTELVVFPPKQVSLESYRRIPDSLFSAYWRSLGIAVTAVVIALVTVVPAALRVSRMERGRSLTEGFLRSPLQVPTLIVGAALLQTYVAAPEVAGIQVRGTVLGIVLAHIIVVSPFIYTVVVGRARLTRELERAAQGLGASWFYIFRRVTLPLLVPALIASAAMGFLVSMDEVPASVFLAAPQSTTFPVALFLNVETSLAPYIFAAAMLSVIASAAVAALIVRSGGLRTVLSAR